MGLHMAGFDVEGVDIEPQPNYPFKFYRRDALALSPRAIRRRYDLVVASPPCLGYTTLAARYPHIRHAKLIPATRDLLEVTGLPYVIENVENAKGELHDPIRLCGSSFGLRVRRHRLFELGGGFTLDGGPECNHQWQDRHKVYAHNRSNYPDGTIWRGSVGVHGGGQLRGGNDHFVGSVAMGIDWMTREELNQAIPPVYSYWWGQRLRKYIESTNH